MGLSPMDDVMEEGIGKEDPCWTTAHLLVNRRLNMTGGRPSDAARSEVHWHTVWGCEKYMQEYDRSTKSLYGDPDTRKRLF